MTIETLSIQQYSKQLSEMATGPQRVLLSTTDQLWLAAIAKRLERRLAMANVAQSLSGTSTPA